MAEAVRIEGLTELLKAAAVTEAALEAELRTGLLAVAEIVADETVNLMGGSKIDFGGRTIAGVKARVAADGTAWAQQQQRKSSRLPRRRQNFGPLQMTEAFLPAIENKQTAILAESDRLVQVIVTRHFT